MEEKQSTDNSANYKHLNTKSANLKFFEIKKFDMPKK